MTEPKSISLTAALDLQAGADAGDPSTGSGLPRFTMVAYTGGALGCGQQKGYHETYRGVDIEVNLLKKVRLEIAVNEAFVQPTIDAIIRGARTGEIGDGKIFVLPLERCVRIRSGEEGNDAIG